MSWKQAVAGLMRRFGLSVRRTWGPSDRRRAVGDMLGFLQDVKARGLPCHQVLDIGAHKADWSRFAKAVYLDVNSTMIEPQVEMEPWLRRFCDEFAGSEYVLKGAGAACGELDLDVWEDHGGSTFLPGISEKPAEHGLSVRKVSITTVDELLGQGMPMPQIVKIDVQGFELEVLRGGSRLFGPVELFIIETSLFRFLSERHPLASEIVAFLHERDYCLYDLAGFIRRPHDGALGQVDLCFARTDGHLRSSSRWA